MTAKVPYTVAWRHLDKERSLNLCYSFPDAAKTPSLFAGLTSIVRSSAEQLSEAELEKLRALVEEGKDKLVNGRHNKAKKQKDEYSSNYDVD